jgi:hypothetical protein
MAKKIEVPESKMEVVETAEVRKTTIELYFDKTCLGTYGSFFKDSIHTLPAELAMAFIKAGDAHKA